MRDEHAVATLLARFDEQVRRTGGAPAPGWAVVDVEYGHGRVRRLTAPAASSFGGAVLWSALDAASADAAVDGELARARADGRRFEWKLYGHDRPADLADRLVAAGFVAEDEESLVVGSLDDVLDRTSGAAAPDGVEVRDAHDDELEAIGELQQRVWGGDWSWLVDELRAERAAAPDDLRIVVASAGGELVCAGWVRTREGGEFASLWGGSTLPTWRGRGIYRAVVRRRAELAAARGCRWLQVDASPDSRPILERLGLHALTWTRPMVWGPDSRRSDE